VLKDLQTLYFRSVQIRLQIPSTGITKYEICGRKQNLQFLLMRLRDDETEMFMLEIVSLLA